MVEFYVGQRVTLYTRYCRGTIIGTRECIAINGLRWTAWEVGWDSTGVFAHPDDDLRPLNVLDVFVEALGD